MLALTLILVLTLLQAQQTPDHVSVILAREGCTANREVNPWGCTDVIRMTRSDAQATYERLKERKGLSPGELRLLAALIAALNATTLTHLQDDVSCLRTEEIEHQRFQRQPLQGKKSCKDREKQE